MQVGEAFVTVRPDTRGFGPQLESEVTQSGQQAASGLQQAFGAAIFAGLVNQAIQAASGLEQAIGGTAAVFGDASGAVDAWAANSVNAVGLSEEAYRNLSTVIGNQLTGVGFSFDEAAAAANQLITVGADAAATFGGTTAQAVEALTSAFRGEYDAADRFVAGLTAANVAAEAVRLGLAESTGAVSSYARAQATLSLIMQASAGYQGQFQSEMGTTANAQQRAAAEAQNAAAAFGDQLLPAVSSVLGIVAQLASAFGSLPDPIQTAVIAIGGLAVLRGPIGAVSGALGVLRTRAAEAGGGFAGLRAAITPGAIGATAAVAGLALITYELARQAEQAARTRQAIQQAAAAFDTGGTQGLAAFIIGDPGEFQNMQALLDQAGVSVGEFVDAFTEGGPAAEDMANRMRAAIEGMNLSDSAEAAALAILDQYIGVLEGGVAAANEMEGAQEELEGATGGANATLDDQVGSMQALADAADAVKEKIDALFGAQRSVAEGSIDLRDGMRDLRAQLAEMPGGYQAGTESGDEFLSGLMEQATAVQEQVIAMAQLPGATAESVGAAQQYLLAPLVDLARQAGLTEQEIQSLLDVFGLTPEELILEITGDGEPARNELEAVLADMTAAERKQFLLYIGADGTGAQQEGERTGGLLDAIMGRDRTGRLAANGKAAQQEGQRTGSLLDAIMGRTRTTTLSADPSKVKSGVDSAVQTVGNVWTGHVFTATLEARVGASVGAAVARVAALAAQVDAVQESGPAEGLTVVINGDVHGDPYEYARSLAPVIAREIESLRGII